MKLPMMLDPLSPVIAAPFRTTNTPGIHRLPHEMLSEIFVLVLPATLETGASRGFAVLWKAQVVVGSVCTRWRQVSQATPRFWRSCVVVGAKRTKIREFHEEMLRRACQRSGNVDLHTIISLNTPPRASLTTSLIALAALLLLRTTQLNIRILPGGDPSVANALFPLPYTPRLASYNLQDTRRVTGPISSYPSIFHQSHPRPLLTTLTIHARYHNVDLEEVEKSCLQTLRWIRFENSHRLLNFVANCPRLHKARLPFNTPFSAELQSQSITHLQPM